MRLFYLALIAMGFASPAAADILLVHADGSGEYPTIQSAIDAAVDGDEVLLTAGTFQGDGNRDVRYHGKAITVNGSGPDCGIDPQSYEDDPHSSFLFTEGEGAESILSNVTIGGATWPWFDSSSSIIIENASPLFRNCIFQGNQGTMIESLSGHPRFEGCIWRDLRCFHCSAPALYAAEAATLIDCEIDASSDALNGIIVVGTATILRSSISGGAKYGNGGLVAGSGSVIEDSSISGYAGGFCSALSIGGPSVLRRCTIVGYGSSAVCVGGGCLLLQECTIEQDGPYDDIYPPTACVRRVVGRGAPADGDALEEPATSWGQIKAEYR